MRRITDVKCGSAENFYLDFDGKPIEVFPCDEAAFNENLLCEICNQPQVRTLGDPSHYDRALYFSVSPNVILCSDCLTASPSPSNYEHCAPDMGGNIAPHRKRLIAKARAALAELR